jgi:hypothetical protein
MPKKVKSRLGGSIFSLEPAVSATSFAPFVVRGIVRGLLFHLCARQRGEDLNGPWRARAERRIMARAEAITLAPRKENPTEGDMAAVLQGISNGVEQILSESRRHTYFTLSQDSDLILSALTKDVTGTYDQLTSERPYDEQDRKEQRIEWLQREVPSILKALDEYSGCLYPACVQRTACPAPSDATLCQWGRFPHAAELRNRILGHFHGLTPSRVKRLLNCSPRT